MPNFIVKQPNGLLANFSTIVDNFTALDMTEAEAVDYCREHMGRADAEAKVRRGAIDEPIDARGSGPGSGHGRWDDCLVIIRNQHGDEGLAKFRAEYPECFHVESPMPDPMRSYSDLDSVTVICPCGKSISGEGDIIDRFFRDHAAHTNGECVNECTDDGARAWASKPPPRTYRIARSLPMPLSDADLVAIREREAAATSGPWYAHNLDDAYCMNVDCVTTNPDEPDTCLGEAGEFCREIIALTLYQSPRIVCHDSAKWEQNAVFIAHARTDIPQLLAELTRLKAENERLREELAVFKSPTVLDEHCITEPGAHIQAWAGHKVCCSACDPNYPGMMLCSTCGNKRCPHAANHENTCTRSNELGQPGSNY